MRRGMNAQEFQQLVEFLEGTPERIRQLTGRLSEEELKYKPSADEFSALEQVCHLRDIEEEGYSLRIRKIMNENRPALPDLDGSRLARERDYNNQDFASALQAFGDAREENVRLVRTLTSEQLNRSGMLEGVGEVTIERLLLLMREHDQGHLGELSNLRAVESKQ